MKPNKNETEKDSWECAGCRGNRGELEYGKDALVLERVVIGPRGPIPVGEMKFFHVDECFEEYVCNGSREKLPKRIP